FCKSAIGGEAIVTIALVHVAIVLAVVVARRVHAHAAALALAAARMDFDRYALADLVFVNALSQSHDRAHIFMARRVVLVERQTAIDLCGWTVADDFVVGCGDG